MKACVDIGGTKVAVSLARNNRIEPSTRVQAPTCKKGGNDALGQQVLELIQQAQAQWRAADLPPEPLQAIGIAACGPLKKVDGAVHLVAPNICGGLAGPQRGLPNDWLSANVEGPVRAALPRLSDQAVLLRVENDCTASVEAERLWGALQGSDHCAYVTWSTGIGAGVCVDGHVLHGKQGNAAHVGHIFVDSRGGGALCGCGKRDDLESLVAGNAIERRLGLSAAELLGRAAAGDKAALAQVDDLCSIMGRALYNLVILYDLDRISMGGSVFWHHQDLLLPRLRQHIQSNLAVLTDGVELVPCGLGAELGDYAALSLVAGLN